VDISEFDAVVAALPGVRRRTQDGLWRWQCRGRLLARQLDDSSVVVRVPFDVRDLLLRESPDVFRVPTRFAKHMMVVADLTADDRGAVEDAVLAAWRLQTTDGSTAG